MRTRAMLLTMLLAAGPILGGCGYMWVKKSDWEAKPKVVVDSTEIVSLREQLALAQAKYRADSIRLSLLTQIKPPPPPTSDSTLKAREAEIVSLKEQLAKAQDELERIKRRLAAPRS